mmetsp:Transcript_14666/g.55503  ORF Transcript_14666/g.55503 Transcript_14666/m.55503 type:complete len:215 (+) Transcript_14666:497-1141(+)
MRTASSTTRRTSRAMRSRRAGPRPTPCETRGRKAQRRPARSGRAPSRAWCGWSRSASAPRQESWRSLSSTSNGSSSCRRTATELARFRQCLASETCWSGWTTSMTVAVRRRVGSCRACLRSCAPFPASQSSSTSPVSSWTSPTWTRRLESSRTRKRQAARTREVAGSPGSPDRSTTCVCGSSAASPFCAAGWDWDRLRSTAPSWAASATLTVKE